MVEQSASSAFLPLFVLAPVRTEHRTDERELEVLLAIVHLALSLLSLFPFRFPKKNRYTT
jgi:hypothetical protein